MLLPTVYIYAYIYAETWALPEGTPLQTDLTAAPLSSSWQAAPAQAEHEDGTRKDEQHGVHGAEERDVGGELVGVQPQGLQEDLAAQPIHCGVPVQLHTRNKQRHMPNVSGKDVVDALKIWVQHDP